MSSLTDVMEVSRVDREGEVLRALTGERDRAVFELHKVRGELRRVTQQLDVLKEEHKGCGGKQRDSQRTLEGIEAEYQKLRAADTAKALEGTTTIVQLRQTIAELNRQVADVELRLQESELARSEANRRLQVVMAQGSLRQQLEVERSTIASLERQRAVDANVISRQSERIAQLEHRLESAQENIQGLEARIAQQVEAQSQQLQVQQQRFVSLQQRYRSLLSEGRQAAEEAHHALDLSLREHPTMYRSGTSGLLAWLESYHLEALHSCLINSGFNDLLAVMHITDDDLIAMKQTVGTRRKFLGAAAMLQQQFADAPRGTEAAASPLGALERWMRDFEAIIDAEEPNK